MNEVETDKLRFIANDTTLVNALSKLFSTVLGEQMPQVMDADNSLLGEKYRAYEETRVVISKAFLILRGYEAPEKEEKETETHI